MDPTIPSPARPARRVGVVLGSTLAWLGLFFLAAGTIRWPRGWVFGAVYLANLVLYGVVMAVRNPGLLAARSRKAPGTKGWDRVFGGVWGLCLLALPVVAGLDVRFGWGPVGCWGLGAGIALQVLGAIPIAAAMGENPHLEVTVRIQEDRGHRVVTTGPYRVVRHPMYTGAILTLFAAPLALGGAWALVPAVLGALAMGVRTALEDRTLQAELPGYADYARRTRYRLVPGVW